MTETLETLLADLGVEAIPTYVTLGPRKTKAVRTLQKLFEQRGPARLRFILRSLIEVRDNDRYITEPVLWALDDLISAHPSWATTGHRWFDALRAVDLGALVKRASANRKACPPRHALSALLHNALAPAFEAPPRGPSRASRIATFAAAYPELAARLSKAAVTALCQGEPRPEAIAGVQAMIAAGRKVKAKSVMRMCA